MMRQAMSHGYDYVAQTERLEMQFARGESTDKTAPDDLAYLAKVYGGEPLAVQEYLQKNIKIFTDVGDWTAYSSTIDFAVGTRLHGVIATLLGGTPAVLVTHDSRTIEMAKQAGIPSVSAKSLVKKVDVQKIYDEADFDNFNRKQKFYYNKFVRFFKGNNVETNLGLEIEVD
jgi:polysaccharide pyruvyl transferase WcaK-like protein